MIFAVTSFAVAFVLTLVLVPVLSKLIAAPWGLLDQPDNNRKLHKKAIPLVGGIAVFISIAITALGLFIFGSSEFGNGQSVSKPDDDRQFIGLLI